MILLENVSAILLFALTLLAAGAGGMRLLQWLGLKPDALAERFALGAGLGLGALSLAMTLAGCLGLLRPSAAWLALLALGLIGFREARQIPRALRRLSPGMLWGQVALPARPFAGVVALAVPVYALACLAPPLEGDSLAGYLSVPAAFVRAGAIHPIEHKWYDDLPLNVQMLSGFALLLHGDILAQLLVGFGMGGLSLLAIYAICRRWFSLTVFAVAAAAYYTLGEIAYGNASTKIDSGWAFFELLLLLSFGVWLGNRDGRWLLLSGIFGGLALGSKFTAVYSLAVLGAVALALTFGGRLRVLARAGASFAVIPMPSLVPTVARSAAPFAGQQRHLPVSPRRGGAAELLAFFGPIVVLGSLWFVKNVLYSGNPFFPLFQEWFDGRTLIVSVRHANGPLGLLTIWWDMSVGYITGTFGKPVGPLILALLPGLLLLHGVPTPVRLLLGYATGVSVLWYLGLQYPRNLLPGLAALGIVAGYVFERLTAERRGLRWLLPALLVVPLAFTTLDYARVNLVRIDRPAYAAGLRTREDFLAAHLGPLYPTHDMARYINDTLPPDARILALMNGNDYYLERAFLQSNELDQRAIHHARTPDEALDVLRTLRITHVYVNDYVLQLYRDGYGTHAPYQPTLLEQPEFQADYMELAFTSGPQRLYALRLPDSEDGDISRGGSPPHFCRPPERCHAWSAEVGGRPVADVSPEGN